MKQVEVLNRTRPLDHPLRARYCESFWCKLRGLTLRRRLPPEEALILVESRPSRVNTSIHMLGMFLDLGIIWLDENLAVVDMALAHRWRSFIFPRKPARYVLECAVSRYEEFHIGDKIAFE